MVATPGGRRTPGLRLALVVTLVLVIMAGILWLDGRPAPRPERPAAIRVHNPASVAFLRTLHRMGTWRAGFDAEDNADDFPALYRRALEEGGFRSRYAMAPGEDSRTPGTDTRTEAELVEEAFALETTLEAETAAPIPYETVRRTARFLLLAGSLAEQSGMASRGECAGTAAGLLFLLEQSSGGRSQLALERGWAFYLSGDAVRGAAELETGSRSTDRAERRRYRAVAKFIRRHGEDAERAIAALDSTAAIADSRTGTASTSIEPWDSETTPFATWEEILRIIRRDGHARTEVMDYLARDEAALLPRLIGYDEFVLGDTSAHTIGRGYDAAVRAYRYVERYRPGLMDGGKTLKAERAHSGVIAPALIRFLRDCLLHSALMDRSFAVDVLGWNGAGEAMIAKYRPVDADVAEYLEAYEDADKGRIEDAIRRYQALDPDLADPHLLEHFVRKLPEAFGAPLVNRVASTAWPDWTRYRAIGRLQMRYGWYRVASENYRRSLKLNPWQDGLSQLIDRYERVDSGIPITYTETRPLAMVRQCFSVWDDEMETGLRAILADTERELSRGWVVELTHLMARRGWHDTALAWGRARSASWPHDIVKANFSAQLGWILLFGKRSPESALVQFQDMVSFGNGGNMVGVATSLEWLGRTDEAEAWFRRNDERYAEASTHFLLASFHVRCGRLETAYEVMGDSNEFDTPDKRRRFFSLAMTWYDGASYPTLVRRIYDRIAPDRERWISYDYSNWAVACFVMKDYAAVERILGEAHDRNKTNPFMDYLRYAIACRRGDWAAAKRAIARTTGGYYHSYLPRALAQETPEEELILHARGQPQYHSYLSSMWGLLGYRHLAHGETAAATRCFRRASGALKYREWALPIMAAHETGEMRVPVTGVVDRQLLFAR